MNNRFITVMLVLLLSLTSLFSYTPYLIKADDEVTDDETVETVEEDVIEVEDQIEFEEETEITVPVAEESETEISELFVVEENPHDVSTLSDLPCYGPSSCLLEKNIRNGDREFVWSTFTNDGIPTSNPNAIGYNVPDKYLFKEILERYSNDAVLSSAVDFYYTAYNTGDMIKEVPAVIMDFFGSDDGGLSAFTNGAISKNYAKVLSGALNTPYSSLSGISINGEVSGYETLKELRKEAGYIKNFVNDANELFLDILVTATDAERYEYLYDTLPGYARSIDEYLASLQHLYNDPKMEGASTADLLDFYAWKTEIVNGEEDPVLAEWKSNVNLAAFAKDTKKVLSTFSNVASFATSSINNYFFFERMMTESKGLSDTLRRMQNITDDNLLGDRFYRVAGYYADLIDLASESDESEIVILAAAKTLVDQVNKMADKYIKSKLSISNAVSYMTDSAKTGNALAQTISKSATKAKLSLDLSLETINAVTGMKAMAERVTEIRYIDNVRNLAIISYNVDLQAYRSAIDNGFSNEEIERLADNVIEDMFMLKRLTLRAEEIAYKCVEETTDTTVRRLLNCVGLAEYDKSIMNGMWSDTKTVLVETMINPISDSPFVVGNGAELTIYKTPTDYWAEYSIGGKSICIRELDYKLLSGIEVLSGGALTVINNNPNEAINISMLLSSGVLMFGGCGETNIGNVEFLAGSIESCNLSGNVNLGNSVGKVSTITLNGSSLNFGGSISAKTLKFQGGAMTAGGNVHVDEIIMHSDDDYLLTKGKLTIGYGQRTDGDDLMTAGTIEIKGDFSYLNNDVGLTMLQHYVLKSSGTHKLIISGEGHQVISLNDQCDSNVFGGAYNQFATIYLRNQDVEFTHELHRFNPGEDIVIGIPLKITNVYTNGHTVEFTDKLSFARLYCDGGEMIISGTTGKIARYTGNMDQYLTVTNGGTFTFNSSLSQRSISFTNTTVDNGSVVINGNYAAIETMLSNVEDKLIINGNLSGSSKSFYKINGLGQIHARGNISNVDASEEIDVYIDGSKTQSLGDGQFLRNVHFINAYVNINTTASLVLHEDASLTSKSSYVIGSVKLYNCTLTLNNDLIVSSIYGEDSVLVCPTITDDFSVNVEKGNFVIKGDLRMGVYGTNPSDVNVKDGCALIVEGTMLLYEAYLNETGKLAVMKTLYLPDGVKCDTGIIEAYGDIALHTKNTNRSFTLRCEVQMKGSGLQFLDVLSSGWYSETVENLYVYNPNFVIKNGRVINLYLETDYIDCHQIYASNVHLNGHTLVSNRDLSKNIQTSSGGEFSYDPSIKHNHFNDYVYIPAKDATCLEYGNLAYYSCVCGKAFNNADGSLIYSKIPTINPLGHIYTYTYVNNSKHLKGCERGDISKEESCSYQKMVKIAATKDNNGVYLFRCSECGHSYEEEFPFVCKHKATSLINVIEPTCKESGYSGDTFCSGCDEVIKKGSIVSALGHGLSIIHEECDPKCTEEGQITYYSCGRCNELFEDEGLTIGIELASTIIPETGHNLGKWLMDGNNHWHECEICHELFDVEEHSYDETGFCVYCKYSSINKLINYHLDGGTNNIKNPDYYDFTLAGYISLQKPTKDGYIFKGWYTDPDFTASISRIVRKNALDYDLYAKWQVNTYSVKFSGNRSTSGRMAVMKSLTYDEEYVLPENQFSRKGYIYSGWNTKADGSGDSYSDGQSIKNLVAKQGGSVTLYAQWTPINYTVVFDGNGGEGCVEAIEMMYGTKYKLPENAFVLDGYDFTNWNTDSVSRGKTYKEGASVSNLKYEEGDVLTLYARYKPKKYTIIFDGNGGVGTMSKQIMNFDTAKPLLSNKYKMTGQKFLGWSTDPYASSPEFFDGEVISKIYDRYEENITLYAVWEYQVYSITYIADGGEIREAVDSYTVLDEVDFSTLYRTARKTGYYLAGLYYDSSFRKPATLHPVGSTGDLIIYLKWSANNYGIRFNSNGGEGEMEYLRLTYDKPQALTKNTFKKEGCSFLGWSTEPNGSPVYYDGQMVLNLCDDNRIINLYAVWSEPVSSVVAKDDFALGEEVTIPDGVVEYDGHYYMLIESDMSYENMEELLDNYGCHLAIANDEEELLFLSEMTDDMYIISDYLVESIEESEQDDEEEVIINSINESESGPKGFIVEWDSLESIQIEIAIDDRLFKKEDENPNDKELPIEDIQNPEEELPEECE